MTQTPKPSSQTVVKPKIFGTLLTDVIRKDTCSGCGACVSVCPPLVIVMKNVPGKDEQPTLVGKCILCEYCYNQCPWTEPQPSDVDVFGRPRRADEELGVMLACYSARTTKEEIRKVAADGGVVTSLLAYMLQTGIADCAVVSGFSEKEPWKPVPKVVFTLEELLQYAGTRYTVSPTLLGLSSAVEEYNKCKVAVVGTPCQVKAVRKMQTNPRGALKLGSKVALTIGLFCMESFYYEGLFKEYLQKKIDLTKNLRFAIKKGKFMVDSDGQKVVDVPLDEVKSYVRGSCHNCVDFTAELADISVGGVGSPDGWSTVIIRTEKAKSIFEDAVEAGFIEYKPIEQVKPGLTLVKKLSKMKKEKHS
ncbi:coenzyme F420 hydrogenase subunit beta [Candidatus Bathyarchaeota archaeon]|nr:MAG: coenzyme F420 hydrogenase subunit beta [Candidatus Bathyarchaeota archaeon]